VEGAVVVEHEASLDGTAATHNMSSAALQEAHSVLLTASSSDYRMMKLKIRSEWAASLGKVIFPLLYSVSTRPMGVMLVTDKSVWF
jgi:hypothetical protein